MACMSSFGLSLRTYYSPCWQYAHQDHQSPWRVQIVSFRHQFEQLFQSPKISTHAFKGNKDEEEEHHAIKSARALLKQ